MHILVTGASGYVGERFVALASRAGHRVVAATRQRPLNHELAWVAFDLADSASFQLPHGIDAVVHLAAVTTASDTSPEAEIQAAHHLANAASRAGALLLFVSSQVARPDAPTPYGRTKWAIEQIVEATGGISIRPGQVYGGPERGLFGVLVRLVRALPVLPAFIPAPRIQPIHVDDLASGFLAALGCPAAGGGVLCLGAPTPVTFTAFLALIARQRVRAPRARMPVPAPLVLLGVNLLGTSLASRLGLDKLKSLFDVPAMETGADLAMLGLTLRPIEAGMARSGNDRRRRLAREGTALLTYILRQRPARSLVARYVRVIEALRAGQALGLPGLLLRLPAMMALVDTPASRGAQASEAGWRLNAAMAIAEASPAGCRRFLGRPGRPAAILGVGRAVALATAWRLARPLASPFLRALTQPTGPDDHVSRR